MPVRPPKVAETGGGYIVSPPSGRNLVGQDDQTRDLTTDGDNWTHCRQHQQQQQPHQWSDGISSDKPSALFIMHDAQRPPPKHARKSSITATCKTSTLQSLAANRQSTRSSII